MHTFFCILLRQDVMDFSNVTTVREGSPLNLFNMRIKKQTLVKDNNQVSDSGAGGQGNVIQSHNVVG